MRQAKNNSIMHKIQLKWTKKSSNKVAKQQIFIKKNIRLKALIPDDKEEVNFLYGNNLQASQPSHDSYYLKLIKLATFFSNNWSMRGSSFKQIKLSKLNH